MISYMPMMRTLEQKGLTVSDIEKSLGISQTSIRQVLNKNRYLRIDSLLRIANILNCKVEDLVCWKEGQGVEESSAFQSINWDFLIAYCRENKVSFRSLSLNIGRSEDFLRGAKNKRTKLSPLDVEKICSALGVDKEKVYAD